MASRGCGANRNAREVRDPDRQASWRGAGSRCRLRCPTAGSRLRGSASENRHGGAPREVPVAPGQVVARRRRDRRMSAACRRSIHPSSGGRDCCCRDGRRCQTLSPADAQAKAHAKRRTNPDAATRRGNEETTLFDIVKRIPTTAHARAAMSRAGALRSRVPGERASASEDPGPRGVTAKSMYMSPLGPGSRFARPGHELTAQSRATASPSRSPVRHGRSSGSRRNRRRRRRGSRTR